jgi:hypothetical protein
MLLLRTKSTLHLPRSCMTTLFAHVTLLRVFTVFGEKGENCADVCRWLDLTDKENTEFVYSI